MKKVRIAQIGTSIMSHGNWVWNSLKRQTDIFEIVGFAFPENEREKFPEQMKDFEGFREMTVDEILSDPTIDGVIVETEEIYLTKYALMVAKAGKHLHMEKPGGQNLADFEEMIEAMRQSGKVFSTGYMYRHNPKVKEILAQIDNGEFGEIISVDAQMSCTHDTWVRNWLSCMKGGMLFFLGCHLIDLIYRIQGNPENVIPLTRSTGLDGATGEDFGMAALEYKNGVSTAKTTDVQHGGFQERQLLVIGSKKTAVVRPLEMYVPKSPLLYSTAVEYSSTSWHDKGVSSQSEVYDRFDTMMATFAKRINGEYEEKVYTLDYELGLYKLVLKCCNI
ncbi:MAG: Gfo/Idh/MocA family oxidoreductase [Clostridia bacterium]|nr:Gfo/Idh/MocA family oxidoreductase [Clostridia bacterium]